jgi:predicted secreted hydrolase
MRRQNSLVPRFLTAITAITVLLELADGSERSTDTWKKVVAPRPFLFPDDHAAHEDYRVEWWYYTGNLQTVDGRRFGFELTFFRAGVDKYPKNPSRWAVRDLYIAHFAISDIRDRRFHFFERSRRAGVGWAGASTERYHVWNEGWEVRLDGDDHLLKARDGDYAIQLRLSPKKPPVLQGDRGLSQKGPSEGNASYYYSLTRMKTSGSLTLEGETIPVTGLSWMDHEFSSSFLEKGQQGWDWMAIQLDNNQELMIYQIRRNDGTSDIQSSGTVIDEGGRPEPLHHDQFQLIPKDRWRSPASGARYPVLWTVRLPEKDTLLRVQAAFPEQEMNTLATIGTPYWEGSVVVTGTWEGAQVRGRGYLEMTGYRGRGLGGVYD